MRTMDNVVRIKNKSYYVDGGLRYLITRIFCNPSAKKNLADANDYMGSKDCKEGVIWSSGDDRTIIICANDDKGTPYVQKKRKCPWLRRK